MTVEYLGGTSYFISFIYDTYKKKSDTFDIVKSFHAFVTIKEDTKFLNI
jgi:hypothetical protein